MANGLAALAIGLAVVGLLVSQGLAGWPWMLGGLAVGGGIGREGRGGGAEHSRGSARDGAGALEFALVGARARARAACATEGDGERADRVGGAEINKLPRKGAWAITFSFSRDLQSSCIKVWGGKAEKYKAAQDQLYARAKANSEASLGKYKPGSQPSIEQSLFVKNYVY
jgi:hypothetical protein